MHLPLRRMELNGTEAAAFLKVHRDHHVMAMRLHGTFMVTAWLFLLPVAMTIARYFRGQLAVQLSQLAAWFQFHRSIAMIGVGFVVAAVEAILVHTNWTWSDEDAVTRAHSIVGLLVIIGAFAQPIVALFRCNPNHHNRYLFTWFHRLCGLSVFVLAQCTIFLSTFMAEPGLTTSAKFGHVPKVILLVYWVFGSLIIFCLELEHQKVWFKFCKAYAYNHDMESWMKKIDIFKTTLLILHIILSTLCAAVFSFCVLFATVVEK